MFINPSINLNKWTIFYHDFICSLGPEAAGIGLSRLRVRTSGQFIANPHTHTKCTSMKRGRTLENLERTQAWRTCKLHSEIIIMIEVAAKKRAKAPLFNMWCCPWCWSNFQLWLLFLFCIYFLVLSLNRSATPWVTASCLKLVVQGHVAQLVLYFTFSCAFVLSQSTLINKCRMKLNIRDDNLFGLNIEYN